MDFKIISAKKRKVIVLCKKSALKNSKLTWKRKMKRTISLVLVFSVIFVTSFSFVNLAVAFVGWIGVDNSPFEPAIANQLAPINASDNKGDSFSTRYSLKLDKSGNPHVVWDDNSEGNQDIYFIRWNGKQWVNIFGKPYPKNSANVSNNKGQSEFPALALDSFDRPHITWDDDTTGNNEIYYVHWDGKIWVNANGVSYPSASANVSQNKGFSEYPCIILDAKGNTHITWDDDTTGNNEIFYVKWDKTWLNVAGKTYPQNSANVSQNDGYSEFAALSLDSNGRPHIVWSDDLDWTEEICYVFWNGKSWSNSYGQPYPTNPANVSQNEGISTSPCIAIDGSSLPHIAWQDDTVGDNEIFYVKWNGKKWVNAQEKVYPSNTANVSRNDGSSEHPSIVLDSLNRPSVTWDDDTRGSSDVFFVKWNGSSWVNIFDQSYPKNPGNLNGGSLAENYNPSLILDELGLPCILWNSKYTKDKDKIEREVFFVRFSVRYEGLATIKTNVDTDGNGIFDNEGNVVEQGAMLNYKISWILDDKGSDPLQSAYIYSSIPVGTKYISGGTQTKGLSYSSDGGKSWISKEPPTGSSEGVYIRWQVPIWLGAAGAPFFRFDSASPDVAINKGGIENISSRYSIELDKNGFVHIAWDSYDKGNIYYIHWNGKTWVNVEDKPYPENSANVSQSEGFSEFPSLALDSNGYPHIAWNSENNKKVDIIYVHWDGKQWVNSIGQSYPVHSANVSQNDGFSGYPSLSLDKNNKIHIVWSDNTEGNSEICYVKWNGETWVNSGDQPYPQYSANVSKNKSNSAFSSMELDSLGNPCITWDDTSESGHEIYFVRWTGSMWSNVEGKPYPENPANVSQNNGSSEYSSLAIDKEGNPHIVWQDTSDGDIEVFYTHWDGFSWINALNQKYPEYSGNVSNNRGKSEFPSLTLDEKDIPNIVWDDDTAGNKDIYFIKLGKEGWVNGYNQEYPYGTAIVSSENGDSLMASVVCDSKNLPHIVWGEMGENFSNIFYIKHAPNNYSVTFTTKLDKSKKITTPICCKSWFRHTYALGKSTFSNETCNPVK